MDDEIETLMVDVRASTAGFKNDIDAMRATVDATLVDGFATAGNVLERGLLSAIRQGSLGFEDLKRVALSAMDRISTQAMQGGMASLFAAPAQSGGLGSVLGGAMGALLGLPGRATGGPVSPGTAYRVGERGPELFVPTSSGRIETTGAPSGRDVRVSIHLGPAKGADAPTALRRSARQVASSVRRALQEI